MQLDYGQTTPAGLSYVNTSPDHMAVLAVLLGLEPPPVDRCRVLEIECGAGANLFSFASAFPGSQFLGIDRSPRHIAEALATADQLGLRNVRFQALDLADVDAHLGTFDYIIAHGVYSWVGPEAQEKLLAVCKQNLAENGIAYVSYNTYPGWHQVNAVRDAMRFHTRQADTPQLRARSARSFVHFLAHSPSVTQAPYAAFMRAYDEFLHAGPLAPGPLGDALLLSNELGSVNEPVYFHEFADRAAQHGLQYLVESDFSSVTPDNVGEDDRELLLRMSSDVIELEQYLDFISNRAFRGTLLCHAHLNLQRALQPRSVARLLIGSPAVLLAPPDGETGVVLADSQGVALQVDHPLTISALFHLAEIWPRRESFPSLVAHAMTRLAGSGNETDAASPGREAMALAALLLRFFSRSAGLVGLNTQDRTFAPDAGPTPVALPYARLQALDSHLVTNVWQERVRLTDFQRTLITLLDGSRTWEHIVEEMHFLDPAGTLLRTEDEPDAEAPPDLEQFARAVEDQLSAFGRMALLLQ